MLCLLPLRGWAQASMPVGTPAAHAAAAGLPCHDAAATRADGAEAGPAGSCTACDLCHIAALPAAARPWPPMDQPRAAPRAAAPPDTGRAAPGRLERPPRAGVR